VGEHDTYTRLVFDLPAAQGGNNALKSSRSAQRFTVDLGRPISSGSGVLNAPGLSSYQALGRRLSLTLGSGVGTPKAQVLPASGKLPARLVIDVPKGAARFTPKPAAKVAPAKAVARPASVRGPVTVIIDPGHGGIYPGMSSRWIVEKDVTLDVALRVREKLQAHGVRVIMTRQSDTQLNRDWASDLYARSGLANTGKIGAFVSIHVNSGPASATGIETYYFGAPMGGLNRSSAVLENGGGSLGLELTKRASNTAQNLLGDLVAQAKLTFSRDLAARVQASLLSTTGAVNRGVKSDAFVVIKDPTTPAILTEIGFGSSPEEGPKLALPAYRDRVAEAIADAIAGYLHTN
jgi:N-acetylmuramoyl-L-alanine amidase